MSDPKPNHYELLGVPADASAMVIRRAYRDRAKTHHPDAGGDAAGFRLVLDAYETLIDPDRRRAYDDRHGIQRPINPTAGGAARTGWSGARGDFSGDVEFPAWMRNITDAVWRGTEATSADAPVDEPGGAAGPGAPADVVWWYPQTTTAAPVVAGPLIIVPAGRRLVALSSAEGAVAWDADLGSAIAEPAVVIGDLAFARTDDGSIHCVELGRGVTRWVRPGGPPAVPGFGTTGDGIVIAGADGRLLVFEPHDGSLRWIAKLAGPPSAPTVTTDDMVVCATGRETLEAVDVRTGRHRWRLKVRPSLALPPCVVGDTVWLAGVAGAGSLVRISGATGAPAGSFAAGQAVAGMTTDGRHLVAAVAGPPRLIAIDDLGHLHLDVALERAVAEPALDDRFAYLADPAGAVIVVDRQTGTIVRTSTVPFEPVGSPQLVPERIILQARDGRLWATTRPEAP